MTAGVADNNPAASADTPTQRVGRIMKLPKLTLTEAQRKFAREVGSVVLGVLIALAIGELADAARWKWRVNNSLEAIGVELGGARGNVEDRLAVQPCMDRRIAQIGAILQQARRTRRLPNVGSIGAPPGHLIVNSTFQVAQSDGVFLHMDLEQARRLASTYTLVTTAYLNLTEQEHQSWRTLRLLENSPGEIDSDLLAGLLQAWSDGRELNRILGVVAKQGHRALREHGIAVPEFYRKAWQGRVAQRGGLQDAAGGRQTNLCEALGQPRSARSRPAPIRAFHPPRRHGKAGVSRGE